MCCWQLFSSGLGQLGEDNCSGLWGFVEDDIMKEVRRARRLVMQLQSEMFLILHIGSLHETWFTLMWKVQELRRSGGIREVLEK